MSALHYENLPLKEKKVLLLRVLGVSEDRISALQSGEVLLSDVLNERIYQVMSNPNDITQSAIVCKNILNDGTSYEGLDPDIYLEHINELKAKGGTFSDDTPLGTSSIQPNADEILEASTKAGLVVGGICPKPFMRYLARTFDMMIILIIVNLIFRVFLGTDPLTNSRINMVWIYLIYVIMFTVEPLLIHRFGTTPGKFILGIRILDLAGNKLSLKAAYLRSFKLLRFGFGFIIPFYNIFRMGISYGVCKRKVLLPWDAGIAIGYQEKVSAKRIACFIALILALSLADSGCNLLCEKPRNRQPLTEDSFYQNCAHVVRYDSISFDTPPDYVLHTINGQVTGVTFTVELGNCDVINEFYNEMYVAFMAFAAASKDADILSLRTAAIPALSKSALQNFDFSYAGVHISNSIEYNGYARNIIANYLYPTADVEDSERHFKQVFTMYLE